MTQITRIDVSSLAGSMQLAALQRAADLLGYIPQPAKVYGPTADGKALGAPYIAYVMPEPAGSAQATVNTYHGPSKRAQAKRAARHAPK